MLGNLLRHFDSVVIRHAAWEIALMRLGFAMLIFTNTPVYLGLPSQPHPTGLAHFFDFTFLSSLENLYLLRVVLTLALICYVCNFLMVPALTAMLFSSVSCGTLSNSQGYIGHMAQPVSLAILAQFLVACYYAFRRGSPSALVRMPIRDHRVLVHAAKVALLSCYVTAAITKIERSDGKWISRTPNLAVQIQKTTDDKYYNTLQPAPQHTKDLIRFVNEQPSWTKFIVGPSLFLEAFAFLALMGRGWAFFIGIGLFIMHWMISVAMQLNFLAMEMMVLIFLINVPFAVYFVARKLAGSNVSQALASAWLRSY
jgi:hypothetical protein